MDDEAFDQLVSSVTPRQNTDQIAVYQNTVGIACPNCDEPFDDMIVCRDEFNRLNLSVALDMCVTTHDGEPLLFTHKP
jgi:uncharacterized protein (UPF0212 family)